MTARVGGVSVEDIYARDNFLLCFFPRVLAATWDICVFDSSGVICNMNAGVLFSICLFWVLDGVIRKADFLSDVMSNFFTFCGWGFETCNLDANSFRQLAHHAPIRPSRLF